MMPIRKRVAAGLAALGFVLSLPALGNVSLKNGNFFMAYTDIVYPGGLEPKVERVYNSKSAFRGIFGLGWGNEWDVRLTVSADGSVVVREYGGGAENRFTPRQFNPSELDKAVGAIAAAAQKMGAVGSGAQLEEYRKKLKTDATFRNDEWEKLRSRGTLPARELPVGSQLQSNRFSYQYITRVKDGYVRSFETGRSEKFNDQGRLVRVSDRNGNSLDFQYRKDGSLEKIQDNFNRKMFFTFNNKGLLDRIEGENGKKAEYKYNELGQLSYSKDVDGNTYTYKYDKDTNMLEIGYADKTTMKMEYYDRDLKQSIKSVRDRDGTLTEYTYAMDPADPGHFTVGVNVKGGDGKLVSKSSYEYFIKRRADGEEWTQKLVQDIDGERTETVYNEAAGLPVTIRRGQDVTTFEYNARGNVTKKVTPTEITELDYDLKVGKVSRVKKSSKLSKGPARVSEFKYDPKGNLLFARSSDGKTVQLLYDSNGRIRSMVDQARRRIDFKYNEQSKPVEIRDPKLGAIVVSYTNSGEVKQVSSPAGRAIAAQVTTAFQNLLDIIRPAGVTLAF